MTTTANHSGSAKAIAMATDLKRDFSAFRMQLYIGPHDGPNSFNANRYRALVNTYYDNPQHACLIPGAPALAAFPLATRHMHTPLFTNRTTEPPLSQADIDALDALANALERNAQLIRDMRGELTMYGLSNGLSNGEGEAPEQMANP